LIFVRGEENIGKIPGTGATNSFQARDALIWCFAITTMPKTNPNLLVRIAESFTIAGADVCISMEMIVKGCSHWLTATQIDGCKPEQ